MVVLLDLNGIDDDGVVTDTDHADPHAGFKYSPPHLRPMTTDPKPNPSSNPTPNAAATNPSERQNPNLNSLVSRALTCYPIITQVTASIDLNSLDALSRTCHQIRHNLLAHRSLLLRLTLRCENEFIPSSPMGVAGGPKWHILGEAGHLVSGKVSTCARDFVSECRRCGRVVCRNCTTKPPPTPRLPRRLRRLCPTCLALPISTLTACSPCSCLEAVHLCIPCGTKLADADTTYQRIWTWRTRYTTYLGGLGTGVGEGDQGVECARGGECKGGREVSVEVECASRFGFRKEEVVGEGSVVGAGGDGGGEGGEERKVGYWSMEVEGLGGVVKKKVRKVQRVGGIVREWEEEREGGEVLGREKGGVERGWCGWCGRVVLGVGDIE